MIFPDFRLSILEQETAQKKAVYNKSKADFIGKAKENLDPLTLIRENKKTVFAALLSMVALGKVFGKLNKFLLPKLKSSNILNFLEAGLFWKILNLSINLYRLTTSRTSRHNK